jgi:hypothetical protein
MKAKGLACFALTSFIACALINSLQAGTWVRNTFPGPGHVANEGPWGPGQGSDRTEYMSFFQVHPANAKFMLQGTDLGRLVYTNTALGGTEFIAAEVPVRHTATCAFDPHDGQTAYVLLVERYLAGTGGWWKTTDEGVTWEMVFETAGSRALLNLLEVNPDPVRKDLVYAGTRDNGIYRSTDGGNQFEPWILPGEVIHQIAIEPGGDFLYAIIEGSQNQLYRIDLSSGAASVVYTGEIRFVDPHPSDDNLGLVVIGDGLYNYTFSNGSWTFNTSHLVFKSTMRTARYNPSNPGHIVMTADGGFLTHFQWSTDGGVTWNRWGLSLSLTTAFVDYGPHNHAAAPDYFYRALYPPNVIRGGLLFDFIPNDPDAVVMWETGYYKAPTRSDDYGATFRPFAHGGNFKNGSQVSIGSTDDILAVCSLEAGVTLSSDGGLSWRSYHKYNTPAFPQNSGSSNFWRYRSTWGVGIDPSNDSVVLAVVGWDPIRILRTEDFGLTWTEVGQIDHTTVPQYSEASLNVHWDRSNPDRVYIHTLRNTNGGTAFTDSSGNLSPGTMLLERPVSTISASNGDIILSKEGAYDWHISLDGGTIWTALPDPAAAADRVSTAVTPNSHVGVQIDPDPMRDPTLDSERRLRVLNGGQGGLWEYLAENSSGSVGTWQLIEGSASNPQPYTTQNWLIRALVDPRPGEHGRIYGLPGYSGGKERGDLGYRQIYGSDDGGATWTDLYENGQQGELPDYVTAEAVAISPSTGALYVFDPTGLYRYGPDAMTWANYPVDGSYVNTGTFLGWLDIHYDPYIWSFSMDTFLYLPESAVGTSGAWVYFYK